MTRWAVDKMGKIKMEVDEDVKPTKAELELKVLPAPTTEKGEYEDLCGMVNAIAQPIAGRKLAKKLYKLVKKSSKYKTYLRQGISDVHKAIRRNENGIVILAGSDVSPVDVYSHMPALCEEKDLQYIFTPSREHLGLAAGHKRPSILLLVREHEDYAELYNEVREQISLLPPIA
ncbi:Putative H/ACA ribonucleoprotein complex subunit 2-like protein [Toxocara canis]|uniref:H/ACA ribonucleoprotein complex subunit 2 n=1 Tax=Toxocara canis TaxID=6265 RepID=A0A0B2UWA1_TOXCA|nr:Putative H/ACA ribonucleoprotein complex subunit 2-like protein [Toxocara canis]